MRQDMCRSTFELFQPSEDDTPPSPPALSVLHFPKFPPPPPLLLPKQSFLHRPSFPCTIQHSENQTEIPMPGAVLDSSELAAPIYGGIGNSSIREHGSQ